MARDLARHFGAFAAIRDASVEDLDAVEGVGPKMAEQIHGFFHDPRNRRTLDELLDGKVTLVEGAARAGRPLGGLKFVFTGTLERLSRREAERLVTAHGAKATSSVSGETDYLVAGANAGSKADKARELGVTTLSEAEFIDLLASRGVEV